MNKKKSEDAKTAKENNVKKEQPNEKQDPNSVLQPGEAKDMGKDEHPLVPDAPKEVEVPLKDFSKEKVLSAASPEILHLERQISDLKETQKRIQSNISKAQHSHKHVKKVDRQLGLADNEELSSESRASNEIYIGNLKDSLVKVRNEIKGLRKKLSKVTKKEKGKLARQRLQSQADSDDYISRNLYTLKKKLLALLNGILSGADLIKKASFEKVRKLSLKEGEKGEAEFYQAFAELLMNTDEKTFILVSGKLKDRLYGAVRLTLQRWNQQEPYISRLVFPEDLLEDIKKAPDPFIVNRPLITSLILRFLNRVLREKIQELISLRNLAKSPEDKDSFTKSINDFVGREDEDVFQIGAGGLRERLNETLRLTLINWQPELSGEFEEVIIAENND